MFNLTYCQYLVERLRPYIGFVYPVLSRVAPACLKTSKYQQASFLMTNRCNARCGFCMVSEYFEDPPEEMTLDKFMVIAKNIHLEKFWSICLSGAGETLLNSQLCSIVSFVNARYSRVQVFITTNGIALTKEKAEELAARNVFLLSVSVNAGTRETYRNTMQVDQFHQVVDHIRYYQQLIRDAPKQTQLSFVAHRKNIEDLPEFVRLANELRVKKVTARYARFYPIERRCKLAIGTEAMLEDSDSLFYHQELSDRYFKKAAELACRFGIHLIMADDPLFGCVFPRRLCHFPFTDVLVGMGGEVFPCCGGEVMFKKKVQSGEYDFGNTLKQDIKKWINNRDWKAVRYSAKHPEDIRIPECGRCGVGICWDGHIKKRHIMGVI